MMGFSFFFFQNSFGKLGEVEAKSGTPRVYLSMTMRTGGFWQLFAQQDKLCWVFTGSQPSGAYKEVPWKNQAKYYSLFSFTPPIRALQPASLIFLHSKTLNRVLFFFKK